MLPLVAWRIGVTPYYTYSLLMSLGLVLATLQLVLQARPRGWSGLHVLTILVCALLPGLAAGRLGYLAASGDPALLQPWGEGLSLPAALLGGALGLAVLALLRRESPLTLWGAVAPGLALGSACGWLGAAAHGAVAGIALPLTWRWAPRLRDLYGLVLPRLPLQYLACAASLGLWALLTWRIRSDAGRAAAFSLLDGALLALLDLGRATRQPLALGLTADQLAALALGLLGLGVIVAHVRRRAPALAT
jgi:prolipoprotein diacylglyceryltransferase